MRLLTRLFLSAAAVALLGGAPLFAQTKAKAENVPTIPHTSVPNFFKLPPDLYFGEGIGIATNSKGHVFVYHRSGDTRLFEFDPNGTFVKEWGIGVYGIEFAHQVRVDPQDNVWVVDEGTNMVIKFNPAGRVVMVLGRRPEPVAGARRPTRRAGAGPNKKYQFGRPTDVDVGCAGQHLHLRRLRQLARREVRQERPLPRAVRAASAGAGPNQLNTPHSIAVDAQGNIYVGDRGNAASSGARQRPDAARRMYDNVGNPWAVCVSPGPHQYLYRRRTRTPTATRRRRGPSPARSTRWSSTARSSASSARPARASASSAPCTRSTAAIPTSCSCRRSRRGARRRSS